MANTEVGAAYVSIIPSLKGFGSSIEKDLSGVLSKVTSVAKKGAAAVGAAVSAASAASVKSASDYEQLTDGMKTLFGDASSQVVADAKSAYRDMGVSANDYMTQVTGIAASLKKSLGGDTTAAAKAAKMAMGDMADNASVFNTSMSDVQETYQSLARGNYQMLDNLKLGFAGTKAGMQELIAKANEFERAQGHAGNLTIDSYADIVQAIHDVQTEMGIAGNAAREASNTMAGSVDMVKASWQNWLTAIGTGEDVGSATQQLVESAGTAAKNVIPVFATAFKNAVQTIPTFMSEVGQAIKDNWPTIKDALEQSVVSAWNAVADMLSGHGIELPHIDTSDIENAAAVIVEKAKEIKAEVQPLVEWGIQHAKPLFSWLVDNADKVIPAVVGIAGAFKAYKVITPLVKDISGVGKAIGTMVSGIKAASGIGDVLKAVTGLVGGPTAAIIMGVLAAVGIFIDKYLTDDSFREKVDGIVQTIGSALMPVLQSLASTLGPIIQGIGAALQWLAGVVGEFLGSFFDAVGSVVGSPEFQALAQDLGQHIAELVAIIGQLWQALEPVFEVVGQFVQAVAPVLGTLLGTIAGVIAGVLVGAIDVVCTAIEGWIDFWRTVIDWIGLLVNAILNFPGAVMDGLSAFVEWVKERFDDAATTVTNAWNGVLDFFRNLPGNIVGFFSGIGDAIGEKFGEAVQAVRDKAGEIWDGIKGIPGKIVDAFANLHIDIPKPKLPHIDVGSKHIGIGDAGVDIPTFSVSWNALGRIIDHPSIVAYGAGEAGPEAIVPLSGRQKMKPFANAIASNLAGSAGSVGNTYILNLDGVQVQGNKDVEDAVMTIIENLVYTGDTVNVG